ncbi:MULTISPECIES: glutathione S-transferase family protein [Sphingomonas]|uniref:Glutathione S-transferase n=1 Tax=Edaphosphingomonas fennica TaxID=114404 RepID=A0A2T4HYL9_9SPHN|nr:MULTISPECIES: glutathione S-transferase family protein [Sphingomonas]MDX3884766.1 glutathione S-transferase family protein [Sphingomonas sp.]PTD21171.1 glutathione S-transferase [Sphingomonas fennica]
MLTIWGRPNSHNVKKVVWFAEEIGRPFVRLNIGGAFGITDSYREMNPNALIPTIEDDGLVLWESNAILRYLAARYGEGTLWPADPAVRARGDKWMDWQFGYADAQRDAFLNLVRHSPEERDAAAIARSAEATATMMAILNQALADRPWLSGDNFGVGDVPMGVYAHSWFALDIERPAMPHVEDWYARLRERPGYAAHVMIPLT